jgi:23S rRNA-/tRNA-specific pseudouridylate synthase
MWAKTQKAARRLSGQFESRRVVKEYWAIVEEDLPMPPGQRPGDDGPSPSPDGFPALGDEKAAWCDWLTRTATTGVARVVEPDTPGARQALTHVQRAGNTLAAALPAGCACLRLWPQTGRTHQLRAQAAARGMPILGDSTYGSNRPFGLPDRIALHARSLQLRHPILGSELRLVAPVPPEWSRQGIDLTSCE